MYMVQNHVIRAHSKLSCRASYRLRAEGNDTPDGKLRRRKLVVDGPVRGSPIADMETVMGAMELDGIAIQPVMGCRPLSRRLRAPGRGRFNAVLVDSRGRAASAVSILNRGSPPGRSSTWNGVGLSGCGMAPRVAEPVALGPGVVGVEKVLVDPGNPGSPGDFRDDGGNRPHPCGADDPAF